MPSQWEESGGEPGKEEQALGENTDFWPVNGKREHLGRGAEGRSTDAVLGPAQIYQRLVSVHGLSQA